MNTLEQVKKQCADFVAELDCAHRCGIGKEVEQKILAMPLPEVTQEPISKHDICRMIESNLRDDVIQLRKENERLATELSALKLSIKNCVKNAKAVGGQTAYSELFGLLSKDDRWKLSSNLAHGARIVSVGVAGKDRLKNFLSGKEIHIAVTYSATKDSVQLELKGGSK